MPSVRIIAALLLAALPACVHQRPVEPPAAPIAPEPSPPPPAASSPPEPNREPTPAAESKAPSERPVLPPSTKAPAAAAKAAGTARTGITPAAAKTATPAAPAAAPPTLDLATLEQRLRDTNAIGVFTKLSIKNQVDDLLAQFKGFHGGRPKPTLVELRQKYELLLLKVVSVLQDGDAQLASAVSSSREAIWGILSDPQKFAQISDRYDRSHHAPA